jgi:hypothetical protein
VSTHDLVILVAVIAGFVGWCLGILADRYGTAFCVLCPLLCLAVNLELISAHGMRWAVVGMIDRVQSLINWFAHWLCHVTAQPCACDNTKHGHCPHCGGKINL